VKTKADFASPGGGELGNKETQPIRVREGGGSVGRKRGVKPLYRREREKEQSRQHFRNSTKKRKRAPLIAKEERGPQKTRRLSSSQRRWTVKGQRTAFSRKNVWRAETLGGTAKGARFHIVITTARGKSRDLGEGE